MRMGRSIVALLALLAFAGAALAADNRRFYDALVPAEVIATKAFVREDHDNSSKRVLTLEEGDAVPLSGEWKGGDAFPWYLVVLDEGAGWVYGQNIQRLDGKPAVQSAATEALVPEPGIVKADKDYVTVIAKGQGTNRAEALEKAWTGAVSLAVGMILSSRSEVNNGELAENIITQSRGVIESFDILGEEQVNRRTTVTIQALVRREILMDITKTYSDAQVVQTDASKVVKAQMDDKAQRITAENKNKSGVALLKDVFDSYGPEMFYSARLDSNIYYDAETKKPYVKIIQKFDQDLFWKDFLPRLHEALSGLAERKTKRFYADSVRKANQQLPKEGFLLRGGVYLNPSGREQRKPDESISLPYNRLPYSWVVSGNENKGWKYPIDVFLPIEKEVEILNGQRRIRRYYLKKGRNNEVKPWQWKAIVPDDSASFTVYDMPVSVTGDCEERWQASYVDPHDIVPLWRGFFEKMSLPVVFVITYLDRYGEKISTQAIKLRPRHLTVYRSIFYDHCQTPKAIPLGMAIAPGYVGETKQIVFLGSANYGKNTG